MTPPTASSSQNTGAISVELEKVNSLIATAKRLVGEERAVDLSALEGKVSALCKAVTDLPRQDGRPFIPSLKSLITGLDELEAALHDRFGPLLFDPPEGAPGHTPPTKAAQVTRAYDALDDVWQPPPTPSGKGS
ncbi:hypothetical protein [Rhodospirillum sp. A1_3_36]|uniref:hypothetical protein n=1 Tax=Rhodospirillum sp. A1_3_36 TaxID=3391666 RepID=UPI0039A64C38